MPSLPLAVDWNELLLDIALPETDRMVAIQWAVMGPIWLFVTGLSWKYEKDIRHFIWGLVMANLAWFSFRTLH